MDTELLRPTLSGLRSEQPLYSQTALFATAFFGGPAAVALLFGLNSQRSRRGAADLSIALAVLVLGLIGVVAVRDVLHLAGSEARIAVRLLGLAAFAVCWLRHRALYRAQSMFGASEPNGWGVGLAAIVVGTVISAGVLILTAPAAVVAP
jgi:lysylphosphatidylglycerol synthetase-like protein (DUF2156 family)